MLRPQPLDRFAAWASVQACDATAFAQFMEAPPAAPPYAWDVGASACVRFDRVMWRMAMAAALRDREDFFGAASQVRLALQEYDSWSCRGAETARAAAEPLVYAAYCSDRARAALGALRQDPTGCTDEHVAFASYAAVCAGTARNLLPEAVPASLVHAALGRCLELHALAQPEGAVGRALGAWRAARRNYALAQDDGDVSRADDAIRALERRNLVLMQAEIVPDRAAFMRPRCIGGGTSS